MTSDAHHTGSHENTSPERSSGVSEGPNAPLSCWSSFCGVQPSGAVDRAHRARLAEQEHLVVAHAENLPGDAVGAIRGEIDHERRDLLRRHLLEALDAALFLLGLGRDRIDHARPGERRDAVRAHLEALHVERDRARQPDDAELRRHVVGLAEIADQRRGRGHVHEGAGILLAEMRGAGAAHVEGAVEMDVEHVLPVRVAHPVEDRVAQDAGIVDQDVDAAEGVERGLDDRLGVLRLGDRERRGDRLAAGLLDLVDHLLRRAGVGAGALQARADVAGDDLARPPAPGRARCRARCRAPRR